MPWFARLLLVGSFGLNGIACTVFSRAPESGYSEWNPVSDSTWGRDRVLTEKEVATRELGPTANSQSVELRVALKRAEQQLLSRRSEQESYYEVRPYLRTDGERLAYLRFANEDARERWLRSKGITREGPPSPPPAIQKLIDSNDIALGMTMDAVKQSWGPPDEMEVAGRSIYGNERWHYNEQKSSKEGYMGERRVVTFEGGVVVGWETR